MNEEQIAASYQRGEQIGVGRHYGTDYPVVKTSLLLTALMVLMAAVPWALFRFVLRPFVESGVLAIGLLLASALAVLIGGSYGFVALKKRYSKARLWRWEDYLVVQRGFSRRNIQWAAIADIQVCDVDVYRAAPGSSQEYYRVRAHLKDGSFRYLLYTDDVRIKAKEIARKINGIVAFHNLELTPADQTHAAEVHDGARTIDDQPSPEDEAATFVDVGMGGSSTPVAKAPVYFIDSDGSVQRSNTVAIGFLSVVFLAVIVGLVALGYLAVGTIIRWFQSLW